MLEYGITEENQMCSTFYKHHMAFEYYPKNMEQEINDKLNKQNHQFFAKYYSEPEIWYIIDGLVSLLMSFKENQYHHGDIQPKNIFIDPHGYIKMSDNSLINYGRTGYLKMIYEPGYKSALSPKLLESFKSKHLHPDHDPIKSDIFSIGITCLCAALNANLDYFYNFATVELLQGQIDLAINEMSKLGFSHQLISTIQSFLDKNEDRRVSLDEIYAFLAKYQDAIRKGQLQFAQPDTGANSSRFAQSTPVPNPNVNVNANVRPNPTPLPQGPAGGQAAVRPGPAGPQDRRGPPPAAFNQPQQQGPGRYSPPAQGGFVESRYP